MAEPQDLLESLPKFIEKTWQKPAGLVTAILIASGFLALYFKDAPGIISISWILASILIISIGWHASRRIPKTKRNKYGFVISIHAEDDIESRKLRADFITPLRKLVKSGDTGAIFDVIELNNEAAEKIQDQESAANIRSKVRAHFMIYGRVRVRAIDGAPHHVIELDGVVIHREVSPALKKKLESEFAELLPRRVSIPASAELVGFQFTSEWTDIIARYIIGIAAAISGDIDTAHKLYTEAQNRLQNKHERFPIYRMLRQRLPDRFHEIHFARANRAYDLWRETKDDVYLEEMGIELKEAERVGNMLPPLFRALAAIHSIIAHDNSAAALTHLKAVKNQNDALWNYNVAFIYGYQGKLKNATRHYREGSLGACDGDTLSQIEEFMCWVVEKRPNHYQIYYCLAQFNWRAKGDLIQAIDDFRKFIAACEGTDFSAERELAAQWITELTESLDRESQLLAG